MTDHYTETNRLITDLAPLKNRNADFDMALAQTHAVLALAEQQRIANLIALAEDSYTALDEIFIRIPPKDGKGWMLQGFRPEIARALRIETT